jgi:hypothetical protein
VEAAGVELITILITRNLLIPGTATTAKKAPLPDPLYVYCTKIFLALESKDTCSDHRISGIVMRIPILWTLDVGITQTSEIRPV